MSRPEVRILHLYDQYLNIYADRGNIQVLRTRCAWRDIDCVVDGLAPGETFASTDYDLIYVGGGQDRDQRMIAERMVADCSESIRDAVAHGSALLAVCGGYQLLGRGYLDADGYDQPGVGLFGAQTIAGDDRLIGNVEIEVTLPSVGDVMTERVVRIAGFENHAGRTVLDGDAVPLGRVIRGYGNDGVSGFEGCQLERAVGTYLHGPLLPRNPELADWLIAAALHHRYGDASAEHIARPVPDGVDAFAHQAMDALRLRPQ